MASQTTDARAVAATLRDLPPPSPEAEVLSAALVERIGAEIARAGGAISFERYMDLALYAPGQGYYSAGSRKLGAEGDFVTAPEISALFSRSLARQCAEVLQRLGGGDLLEFGAGRGVMAADILLELERLDCLPARYAILEVSADLRERQRETLQQRAAHLAGRVQWLDGLPQDFVGVAVANEVLDAMPVRRLRWRAGAAEELGVSLREGALVWAALDGGEPRAVARLSEAAAQNALPEGYETEVNLIAEDWTRDIGRWLARGVVLLIDYGFPRHEFYHPQRSGGTLMCHYRHRAHPDPLILPGLQDITAHVDFTAIAEAALAGDLEVAGFAGQANFLLGCGVLDMARQAQDEREQLELAAQMKRLLMPGEMGELFKVMALARGVAGPWCGFAVRDDRHRL